MPRYHIIITGRDAEAMLDLVRVHKINVLDHGQRRTQAAFLVHAIADETDIQRLKDAGYEVEQREDVDQTGKARQEEVGVGNRYLKERPR